MNLRALYALAVSMLLLSACVTQPKPLQGTYADVTPESVVQGGESLGTSVRWGGRIVSVEPGADSTCFEMISSRIGADARPTTSRDATNGRFIACRAGFYDPAVFEPNREVTFIGRLDGYENRRIGEYDYRFPKITAEVVYLWPVRNNATVVYPMHPPGYYAPGWYAGWRWGWGAWWW